MGAINNLAINGGD
jgi:WD40 repeat protein